MQSFEYEKQLLFLYIMINDNDIFFKCFSLIKKEYFHSDLRKTVQFLLDYVNEYKKLPTKKLIEIETNFNFENEPPLTELFSLKDWFLTEFEIFIKKQALTLAIMNSAEKIKMNNFENIETEIKEALRLSLDKEMGVDYFENPKERLLKLKDKSNIITTGWKTVDKKLFGGFGRGQINIFAGNSGVGKSLFLQNITINWAKLNLNIIYFTLELSEELVSLRLDSIITEKSTREILSEIDTIDYIIKNKKENYGLIQIKYLPPGATTNQLYAYIKEFQIQKGVKPDAIIIDYLDLMYPNDRSHKSDLFIKDKYVTEELRAMIMDMNILCCTASQLNRSAVEEDQHNMSHIAGGISKINTADNVITIYTNKHLRDEGIYRIQFIKTRNSTGVGSTVDLKFDCNCLRITDLEKEETPKDIIKKFEDENNKNKKNVKQPEKKGSLKDLEEILKNKIKIKNI